MAVSPCFAHISSSRHIRIVYVYFEIKNCPHCWEISVHIIHCDLCRLGKFGHVVSITIWRCRARFRGRSMAVIHHLGNPEPAPYELPNEQNFISCGRSNTSDLVVDYPTLPQPYLGTGSIPHCSRQNR